MTATRSAMSATTPRSWVTRITAAPVSSRSSRMRWRICAWIVTSSAVVGSSAIRIDGSQRQRHGDHHALAHAARELVRVGVEPLAGARDPDLLEQLDRPLARLLVRERLVRLDLLDDLVADLVAPGSARSSGPGRSSRSRRRGPGAARRRDASISSVPLSGAVPRISRWASASGPSASSRSPTCRSRTRRRPPAPRRRASVERDAVDGLHDALLGGERDPQVPHGEQRSSRQAEAARWRPRACSLEPDPRVEEGVDDVHDRVQEDDEERAEHASPRGSAARRAGRSRRPRTGRRPGGRRPSR